MSEGAKVAVVTGAASGLGRALAMALGRASWTVIASDIDAEGAKMTAEMLREEGATAEHFQTDVRDPKAFEDLAEAVWARHNRCDLIINNAGVAVTGRVGDVSLEDWRWCLDVDLFGPIHGCHSFAPRMKAQGWGHIVNIASIAGYALSGRMAPYNVAKAGVVALSESLRAELIDHNVGVTVVCPGFFPTGIAKHMRVTKERERDKTQRMLDRSRTSAESVAQLIIEAVEKKRPMVVTPRDAKLLFWMRRLLPSRATELMRWMARPSKTTRPSKTKN